MKYSHICGMLIIRHRVRSTRRCESHTNRVWQRADECDTSVTWLPRQARDWTTRQSQESSRFSIAINVTKYPSNLPSISNSFYHTHRTETRAGNIMTCEWNQYKGFLRQRGQTKITNGFGQLQNRLLHTAHSNDAVACYFSTINAPKLISPWQ